MSKPYRPTCGTEGADFQAAFCDRCERDRLFRETQEGGDSCPILLDSSAYDVTDSRYPKQWIIDEQGPRCTAFEQGGVA
jgi:hypothetical protein